jgi:hypothetical protein
MKRLKDKLRMGMIMVKSMPSYNDHPKKDKEADAHGWGELLGNRTKITVRFWVIGVINVKWQRKSINAIRWARRIKFSVCSAYVSWKMRDSASHILKFIFLLKVSSRFSQEKEGLSFRAATRDFTLYTPVKTKSFFSSYFVVCKGEVDLWAHSFCLRLRFLCLYFLSNLFSFIFCS